MVLGPKAWLIENVIVRSVAPCRRSTLVFLHLLPRSFGNAVDVSKKAEYALKGTSGINPKSRKRLRRLASKTLNFLYFSYATDFRRLILFSRSV
jgi:hypothetical protein